MKRSAPTLKRSASPLRTARIARWLQQRSSSLGIQARLIALVMAVGLPFLVYIGLNALKEADAQRKQTQAEALAAARLVAGRLNDYVGDLNQMLAALSYTASPFIEDVAANDRL